jgi:hypothetical protein
MINNLVFNAHDHKTLTRNPRLPHVNHKTSFSIHVYLACPSVVPPEENVVFSWNFPY